ncbi:hypothetical protein [Streptomyces hainanensis]|uniref:DUF4352 domain-containing protein n=1 Tax=Streptomyces hainanensis TaxID=402648 RepID=A0A4R4TF43_9ACTN|nr:hypothetical protein [Streptomyces hainanensis]TDC73792.1 hypothetical protein E1283_18065 [Streptomyces hainanensis]
MRLTSRFRGIVPAAATLLVLSTAACGSDAESGDDPRDARSADAGGSEEELRRAVEDSLGAINEGDADALLAGQSAACREQTSADEAVEALALIEALYGEIRLEEIEILEFEGTSAVVRGTTGIEALDSAGDDDGARWIWEDGAWRDDSCDDAGSAQDSGQDAAPDPDATVPSDLAAGETHEWDDGVSVTLTGVTEIPSDSLGEFDLVTEGHTPFFVELTIVNDGEQPADLGEFSTLVEGATNGGTVDSVYVEGEEYLEGRLAPGETKEHREPYSIDTAANGSDLVIELWRYQEDMDFDAPTWVATIG